MKTEIIAITDRSSSMMTIRSAVIEGYNSFLADQRNMSGEARMTYTQFDDHYEVVYQGIDIQKAPLLSAETFVPRGTTALRDAIGRTLNEQGCRIKSEGWADKVIVCIITDGGENASKEYTQPQIKSMIEHAEKHGWSFIFLAANQDAFAVGASYGISAATTQNFIANAAGAQAAYKATSDMTFSLRAGEPISSVVGKPVDVDLSNVDVLTKN